MMRRSFLLIAFLLLLPGARASAQETVETPAAATEPTTQPTTTTAPAIESPIPLAEIAERAETVTATLGRMNDAMLTTRVVFTVGDRLPAIEREIELRQEQTRRIVEGAPSIESLRDLSRSWEGLAATLDHWKTVLTSRVNEFDQNVRQLTELKETWSRALEAARSNETPAEVVWRIEEVVAAINRTLNVAEMRRSQVLTLQSRVVELISRVTSVVETVEAARVAALSRILEQDAQPIWSARPGSGANGPLTARESFSTQWAALRSYALRQRSRFLLHAIVFGLLIGGAWVARRYVDAWAANEPNLKRTALIFSTPIATAALLAAFVSAWIYPQPPRLLWSIIAAAALVPAVVVLRRLLEPRLFAVLNVLVAFFFIDQARRILAAQPTLTRWIFVLEMAAGAMFVVWFIRSGRLDALLKTKTDRTTMLVRLLARAAFVLFAVAFIANVLGFVALSTLVGQATLASTYVGVTFYTLTRVFDGLIMVGLRADPANKLRAVREHRQVVWRRIRWVVHLAALVLWLLITLELFSVRETVLHFVGDVLTTSLSVGSLTFSFGSVLAFLFTVWAAFLVSRFVRFVLEEDVYPRLELRRGMPYAISTLLHYAILLGGFILAIAAMGYDMTKFTILAGAFGVGLGFGMQNIVNNFVSGLILLFERPVQIGDTVEIDNVVGTIVRIGIRASIIRTQNGSSVIYPNATLISNRVTNWTLSSSKRRIEIPVAVVLGSDPHKTIELLRGVAEAHPMVEKMPPPEAVMMNYTIGAMNFELRVWTLRPDQWVELRSDLTVAVNDALVQNGIALK